MGRPTPEILRKLLRYEPGTGNLFWRKRTPDMFKSFKQPAVQNCNCWNARFSGGQAFINEGWGGYLRGTLLGGNYLAHRVAWAVTNGDWPANEIDHINGHRDDNRIDNLRDVSRTENCRNTKIPSTNTSGQVGVYWCKRERRWISSIKISGRTIYLGRSSDRSAAIAMRKAGEIKYGFHENHGRTQ